MYVCVCIASFDMKIPVDGLFFSGIQLTTISNTGRVAIWQSVLQHWQVMYIHIPSSHYQQTLPHICSKLIQLNCILCRNKRLLQYVAVILDLHSYYWAVPMAASTTLV